MLGGCFELCQSLHVRQVSGPSIRSMHSPCSEIVLCPSCSCMRIITLHALSASHAARFPRSGWRSCTAWTHSGPVLCLPCACLRNPDSSCTVCWQVLVGVMHRAPAQHLRLVDHSGRLLCLPCACTRSLTAHALPTCRCRINAWHTCTAFLWTTSSRPPSWRRCVQSSTRQSSSWRSWTAGSLPALDRRWRRGAWS